MTEETREILSALMDGELDGQEAEYLLGQMRDDDELRRLWGRYHLVGDMLRGEQFLPEASSLADRVQAQLRDDPAIIAAPRRSPVPQSVPASSVEPTPIRSFPSRPVAHPSPSWRRLAGGAALAASVAALAVSIAPLLGTSPAPAPQQLASIAEPARAPVTEVDADGNRWKKLPSGMEARLNGYLVQHSDYASLSGVGGVLPYTNFVSYDRPH